MRITNNGFKKALVIVHGKSEYSIVRHIRSKLRIPIDIYQKNGGERSIEISSIMDILNGENFKTRKNFLKEYGQIQTDEKNNLLNFKVFIIVDVDNTPQQNVANYCNKAMFKKHWLYDYIVPILNNKDLEEALNSIGYTAAKNSKDKRNYSKVFPVQRGEQDLDTIIALKDAFEKTKKSNLDVFLRYCLENCPNFE